MSNQAEIQQILLGMLKDKPDGGYSSLIQAEQQEEVDRPTRLYNEQQAILKQLRDIQEGGIPGAVQVGMATKRQLIKNDLRALSSMLNEPITTANRATAGALVNNIVNLFRETRLLPEDVEYIGNFYESINSIPKEMRNNIPDLRLEVWNDFKRIRDLGKSIRRASRTPHTVEVDDDTNIRRDIAQPTTASASSAPSPAPSPPKTRGRRRRQRSGIDSVSTEPTSARPRQPHKKQPKATPTGQGTLRIPTDDEIKNYLLSVDI